MVDIATVEAGIALAEKIVDGLIAIAPAVQKGVVSTEPYIAALAGMITGTNATQAQIDALLAQLKTDSADFQTPLPADDGSTTT